MCPVEHARNITNQQNIPLSMGHYLDNMANLTNQWNKYNYKETERQRIYLKDIDCPQIWHDKLKDQMPSSVFYLNESTGDFGGPGSLDEKDRGVARAGDLMSSLPPAMRAENLMCYIGHEGTYTPAHREMCASLGQNLMVETSGGRYEGGKATKPGSSIWFMTETKDRHLVSEYWLSTLGHDIEIENHFAQINAWKAAPFNTYIVEQKVGDFILIPPLAPHQVWNRGTRTMKVAWNRTTVETLEMALSEALPRARMVCRDEQYKNKAIIHFTLAKYSKLLARVEHQKETDPDPQVLVDLNYSPKIRQVQKDFRRLFTLHTQILLSEMLAPGSDFAGEYIPYDSYVTCSFCRCNIFNRFLTCPTCVAPLENGEQDTYDICLECYAMGRSCRCNSNYNWVEQFPWHTLTKEHERWRQQIITVEGGLSEKSPKSLLAERKSLDKKTLAQVCQEQLKIRPWLDPAKPPPGSLTTLARGIAVEADNVTEDGVVKKTPKMRRKKEIMERYPSCHVCLWPEYEWKLAFCTTCDRAYCYGSLFRGFDMTPLSVMENLKWECPHCLKICSCASCRKRKGTKPYEPTCTILGHDTKKVADPRSWEGLVNYSSSNMKWVKSAGDDHPHETKRLLRRQHEADLEKSKDPALDEDSYVQEGESTPTGTEDVEPSRSADLDRDIPIDPMLYHEATENESPNARNRDVTTQQKAMSNQNGNLSHDPASSDDLESRLRHGLQHFNEQFEQSPPRGPAPTARMVEEHVQDGRVVSTDANGITFEYPDPSLGSSSAPTGHFQQPDTQVWTGDANGVAHNILQSDLESSIADKQRNQIKRQQKILEANRNGNPKKRQEKSLLLKLRVDGSKLASIKPRHSGLAPLPSSNTPARPTPQKVILQSDVVNGAKAVGGTVKQPAKRRLTREERDDDFSTRKKPRKAAVSQPKTRMSLPANLNNGHKNYAEDSSDSNSEEQQISGFQPVNGTQKPRGLPSYLARRSLGDHDEPLDTASPAPKKQKIRPMASIPKTDGAARPLNNEQSLNHSSVSNKRRGRPPRASLPSTISKPQELEIADGPVAYTHELPLISTDHDPARNAAIAALNAMPSSSGLEGNGDDLSISSDTPLDSDAEAIDDYPPKPLPKSRSDVDLSKLGPGQATPPMDEAARRAEENRQAKLRALAWAAGEEGSEDGYD